MKELLKSLNTAETTDILFDTCFFIYELKHHKNLKGAVTSFNAEEIIHVSHKLSTELKKDIRESMKHHDISLINIPVHPGNWEEERDYVNSADPDILRLIHDPSDAVLIAAAIKMRAKRVYTRDKHHLYTTVLENYIKDYGIEVLNKFEG
jgi:predicted nucleic acid-binding protein